MTPDRRSRWRKRSSVTAAAARSPGAAAATYLTTHTTEETKWLRTARFDLVAPATAAINCLRGGVGPTAACGVPLPICTRRR